MKKILLFLLLVLFIPFMIVVLFVKDDEIKFEYIKTEYVRVKRKDNSIIKVPLEDYIVGVLAGEMPIDFEEEAFKAQAVAARSYVLIKMKENMNNDYDVVDTVQNQVYLDYTYLKNVWKNNYIKNINKLKKVVKDTKGQYLEYNGEIAQTLYFSTSTGITENCKEIFGNDVPYLTSVDSKWDTISPLYETYQEYNINEFFQKLNLPYSKNLNISYIKRTSTGRNIKLMINNNIYNASDIMQIFNIKSTFFDITKNNNVIKISSKGYGHGVGMSQYGAQAMALQKYKYNQILYHYYKNTKIKKI
ncbi:MAG: stage II sporulation protein D [Bacilli bacterium]|nr:stage II sporulation protein D [Bacilli bacterium]